MANGFGAGGALSGSSTSTSVIDDCHFTNNTATAGNGGAIFLYGSSVTSDFITNCTFTGNMAANSGGGVVLAGGARMIGSTLTGNTAATGGGAALRETEVIDDCTISDNVSTGDGGGVRIEDDTSIINSMVTGNIAAGNGGGMYMIGATATDCPITGNAATGRGGGAYAEAGASHLINCEIATNTAGESGGGVYINDATLVNLIDSTVCPNTPDLIDFHIGGMLLTMNSISCEMTCPGGGDPIGACCLVQGGCATLSEADCIAVGGTYQGDGTSCAKAECPDPQPTCIGDLNFGGVVNVSDLSLYRFYCFGSSVPRLQVKNAIACYE